MGAHSADERFGRYLVAQWDAVDPKKLDEEPLKKDLSDAVTEAAKRADVLVPSDLLSLGVTAGAAREVEKVPEVGEPPQN